MDLARDNTAEGCVREAFGALVATVQAKRAADPVVRRELGRIAVEETRHAALSWAIDGWMASRLGTAQRRALRELRHDAVARLRQAQAQGWSPAIAAVAGMPTAEASLRMLAAVDASLWAA
jgi:hypothetical protein